MANTHWKFQWLISFIGRIENSTISQLTFVMYRNILSFFSFLTFSFLDHFIAKSTIGSFKTGSKFIYLSFSFLLCLFFSFGFFSSKIMECFSSIKAFSVTSFTNDLQLFKFISLLYLVYYILTFHYISKNSMFTI